MYRGVSDHQLVVATLRPKLKNTTNFKVAPRYITKRLSQDPSTLGDFQIALSNNYEVLSGPNG